MIAVPAHGTTHIAPSLCRVVALLSAACWCWVLRMAAEMPDLSHLTPEEREIIESVVHRQKQEEQKEQEIMRRKQEEVVLLEEKIRQRSEQQKKAGVELDATCHICLKTKFADGVGHLCNYCGIRCCARCGGKVTLRSSKVIWVCILCRKKQELLSKSGEWINHGMATAGLDPRRSEVSSPCMMSDKRPKLERAHSAVEKENVPLLQRSNSLLRRQYSQQEPSSRKDQDIGVSDDYYRAVRDDYYRSAQMPEGPGLHRNSSSGLQQSSRSSSSSHHHASQHQFGPASADGKSQHATAGPGGGGGGGVNSGRKHKRPGNVATAPAPADRMHQQPPHQMQHISFSSSEDDELRSTSECTSCDERESEKGDEVLEWNGCLLQGKTQKEVSDIIAESKHLPQIELKVSRSIIPRRASYSTPTKGLYDLRKDMKPLVMVTSPGSPEHLVSNPARNLRASKSVTGPNSLHVGGKIQVKLGFDPQSLKLVVTIMAASNLLPRPDGSPRSAYAKVCLLPDTSEKSKRRTKTIVNSTDPKWNQSFSFTTMRRSDLKYKVLQISLWDYDNNPTNQFLGEVLIELGLKKLENLAEWYPLTAHQEITGDKGVIIGDYDVEYSGEHLSPPSTLSRQSDSDASDVDDCCSSSRRIMADGASISSLGSSISPPPDYDLLDRRKSRRDVSPLQKSYVYGTTVEKKSGYETNLKQQTVPSRSTTVISHRSRSAAPTDSPSQHSRSRSKSPTMISDRRSLSPPDYRYPGGVPSYKQGSSRFFARSATATPTSTPKKRQLPQIPGTMPSSLDERIPYYFDDQTSSVRRRTRQIQQRRVPGRSSGLGRLHHHGGLSDSDIPLQQLRSLTPPHVRGSMMSRGDTGDTCDIDDSDSVISSALSTQSEQPRSTRFCDFGTSHSRSGSQQSPVMAPTTDSKRAQFSRSLSNADVQTDNITESSSSGKRRGDSSLITESSSKSSASGTNSSTSGMGKKSASASQLSATEGRSSKGKRGSGGGGGGAQPNFKRSQEVAPGRQASLTSLSSDCPSSAGQSTEGEVTTFIGKLGPGQKVSRQILGTPYRGDVKIGFNFFVNFMEVTVFEAKDLINVKETKTKLPDTYVKVYLVKGKKCVEKHRTKTIKESLQPKYMEMLKFKSSPAGCLIQVSVWGDYGREKGRKVFMGVAVIYMDSVNTSPGSSLTEWYRLFGSSSL